MSTLTLSRNQLDRLCAGDRIVSVDGHRLDPPHVVAAPALSDRGPVPLENLLGTTTIWRLYVDVVGIGLVVEREDQAPEPVREDPAPQPVKRPRKPPSRVVNGLRLVRQQGRGEWFTEDGRFRVWSQPTITECERPHPVRFTRFMLRTYREKPFDFQKWYSTAAVVAIRANKPGYYCLGGQEHYVWNEWDVWDEARRDYAAGNTPGTFHSFREAAEWLAEYVKEIERE